MSSTFNCVDESHAGFTIKPSPDVEQTLHYSIYYGSTSYVKEVSGKEIEMSFTVTTQQILSYTIQQILKTTPLI